MNPETEKKLLELAKKLADLDREIADIRSRGFKEDRKLRVAFYAVRDEILDIFSYSGPIDDMRNPQARQVLRKIRDGNHYLLDIEEKRLRDLFRREPEAVMAVLEAKGIKATEEEINRHISETTDAFLMEITEWIDAEEYYDRKKQFGTIITDNRLPEKMHGYYWEIQNCFLVGQMRAVVGLCRVLLELAFRSEFARLGLGTKQGASNVHNLNDYYMSTIIKKVCGRKRLHSLDTEAIKLWNEASDVLHGRNPDNAIAESEAMEFAKRTFNVVEQLYTQQKR